MLPKRICYSGYCAVSLIKAWLFCLALLMACGLANADEYTNVEQSIGAKQWAEAISLADKALANKPRDAQLRFMKGIALTQQDKSSEAIALFTRLTEDFPEMPEPYNNLAVLYAGQLQYDKARVALEMAIRADPSYRTAYENLGDIHAKLASQAYTHVLELKGSDKVTRGKLNLIHDLFSGADGASQSGAIAQTTHSN